MAIFEATVGRYSMEHILSANLVSTFLDGSIQRGIFMIFHVVDQKASHSPSPKKRPDPTSSAGWNAGLISLLIFSRIRMNQGHLSDTVKPCQNHHDWLGNMNFMTFLVFWEWKNHPIDELIFFRGVGIPPARYHETMPIIPIIGYSRLSWCLFQLYYPRGVGQPPTQWIFVAFVKPAKQLSQVLMSCNASNGPRTFQTKERGKGR